MTTPRHLHIRATAADATFALLASQQPIIVPDDPAAPLSREIVWMPAGTHAIAAGTLDGKGFRGQVIVDAQSAAAVIASFNRVTAAGRRVWLDKNHENGEATAWVKSFHWDASRGIIATVDWTPLGEKLLREKQYYSFSPEFMLSRETGRVASLAEGHSAGGLVNAPAFGSAMPVLIAARLSHFAPPQTTTNNNHTTTMKAQLIAILASLKLNHEQDATEQQMLDILAKHLEKPATETGVDATVIASLQKQIADLQKAAETNPAAEGAKAEVIVAKLQQQVTALQTAADTARAEHAATVVQAAIDRGALKADDKDAIARWTKLITDDKANATLLASLPGTKTPAQQPVIVTPTVNGANDGATTTQVTAGLADSLKAYGKSDDTKERAKIYATGIGHVLAKLHRDGIPLGPILAANSLGTLAPDIVVQRALALLKVSFPALKMISTDFSAEASTLGTSVITRLRGIPAVQEYTPATGYKSTDASTTDVKVALQKQFYSQVSFNTNELASTSRDLFGEQVDAMHYALGSAFMNLLYAVITAANFPNATIAALADFKRQTLATVAKELNKRGVPAAGRFAMLNPEYFGQLQNDPTIVQLAAFQRAEIITDYMLPRIAGLQPLEAITLPTDENLGGFCGAADSLAIATRTVGDYMKALPGAANGSMSVVTNPDTGISVTTTQFIDHNAGAAFLRVAALVGAAVGNPKSGQRIASA